MGAWSRQQKSWFRVASPAGETPAKILAVDRHVRAYVRTTRARSISAAAVS